MSRLFLIFLAGLAWAAPFSVSADTEQDIRAALDYYAEMWNEDEIDAITGYYHSDFVLITPQGPVSQAQRLKDLATILGDGKDQGVLSYRKVSVRALGEEHAVAYGEMSLAFKDGSAIENWFSTTYVKTPFGWKALLTYN